MGKILTSAVTWIIVLLLAILGMLAGIAFGWFDSDDEPSPTPDASVGPTDAVTPSLTAAPPGFVERPVTTGASIPPAEVLTEAALIASESSWVVAIYDSTQVDTGVLPYAVTPGDKILYLIEPTEPDGTRYEIANLDDIGLAAPDLVAWDYDRDMILLEDGDTTLNVLDMTTGEIATSWTFCPSGEGYAMYGEARGGNWLVRGGCQGDGIDGIYADSGAPVPSDIVGAGFGYTVIDVGDIQLRHEFEMAPDGRFVAFYTDGSSAVIPTSMAGDCYPLGKGRGATVGIYCYSDEGDLSVWELPVDGSVPYEVISASELLDYAIALGYAPGEYWVTGYCSDSVFPIVEVVLNDDQRLAALYGGSVEGLGALAYPYRACHAVSGTWVLMSGDGPLVWTDLDTGGASLLLPGSGSGATIQVVGAEGYTALRQP